MASQENPRSAASEEAAKSSTKKAEAGDSAASAPADGSSPAVEAAVGEDESTRATAGAKRGGVTKASATGNGRPGGQTGGNGRHTDSPQQTVARRPQFMISTRSTPGLQPLSDDIVEHQLRNSPDIEFVKRMESPHVIDLQSTGGSTGSIILARMDFDKAQLLQSQAGPRAMVERDMPLTYSLDPGPADLGFKNPGVLVPHATGFQTTIEVMGDGRPLAGAEVYVFGSVWPTQGVTDESGLCTLSILGESPDTVRALYVKPKIDYWSYWLPRPDLVPSGTTMVEVKPLGAFLSQFPDRQLIGWGGVAMGLDKVPQTMNGAGVKVAIIDSGAAQPTHRNLHEMGPGLSIVGPDADAWTDDTIGHGSHCAGIIAGGPVGPNGVGVRGFAPGAEIHICRIFPGGRFSDLIGALDYCMEHNIDVVNMSLGGGEPSQLIEERLIRAKQMGVACIVAAGNSGGPVQFPASTPHTLAVAAVGKWGEFPDDSYHSQQAVGGATSGVGYFPASFSCFGPEIDVCAPGVAIVSSLPPNGFAAWDGTSMATPHVTGLAALVLAHHPDFKGNFRRHDARRVERLFQIIKESATPLSVASAEQQGAGLPSAPRALGLSTQAASGVQLDGSVEALKKLLALIGQEQLSRILASTPQRQSSPPFAPVAPQATAVQALQLASFQLPAQNNRGEAWSNPPVSRGPASIELASSSPSGNPFGGWSPRL